MHADHDDAVRAHSAALDLEAKGDRLTGKDRAEADRAWARAAGQWGDVLRRKGFWNHIRARVTELDERQLDESVVAVLREHLPLSGIRGGPRPDRPHPLGPAPRPPR